MFNTIRGIQFLQCRSTDLEGKLDPKRYQKLSFKKGMARDMLCTGPWKSFLIQQTFPEKRNPLTH